VQLGVGKAGDEVGRSGTAGGDADTNAARAARVALGGEATALLMTRQDGAEAVADMRKCLGQRHARARGGGEDNLDAMIEQTLDQDGCSGQWGHGIVAHDDSTPEAKTLELTNIQVYLCRDRPARTPTCRSSWREFVSRCFRGETTMTHLDRRQLLRGLAAAGAAVLIEPASAARPDRDRIRAEKQLPGTTDSH